MVRWTGRSFVVLLGVILAGGSGAAGQSRAQPSPRPQPSAAAEPSPAPSAGVTIRHEAVGCVVAGKHPRLDACLAPEDEVGRAQIQFRAKSDGPWWAVDLRKEGGCHTALLPKPLPTTPEFSYFVNVIDRRFGEAHEPDRAPDAAHRVRVVAKEGDCDRRVAVAVAKAAAPIVLAIARSMGGGALSASEARALEKSALFGGFSPDSTVVASTGAPPNTSGSGGGGSPDAAEGKGGKGAGGGGGGISPGAAIILAGAAGAGVYVATHNKDEGGAGDLTGRWSGTWSWVWNISLQQLRVTCTAPITIDWKQSEGSLTGTGSTSGSTCDTRLPTNLMTTFGAPGSGPASGQATGGQISFQLGTGCSPTYSGSYTATSMNGTFGLPTCITTPTPLPTAVTFTGTWSLTKQ